MFGTPPDLNAWFPERDGFPRPEWKAIGEYIKSHSTEDHWAAGWQEMARTWLAKMAKKLGGGYAVAESQHYHLLADLEEKERQDLLKFLETSRAYILRALPGLTLPKWYGKHVVLRFTTEEEYYQYIAWFDPEGEHAGSEARLIVRGGYMHIAYYYVDRPRERSMLAYEIACNLLCHLPLPTWLGIATAMLFERELTGRKMFYLDHDDVRQHQAYWNAETIQNFWSGKSFADPEAAGLSFTLTRVLVDFILTDVRPKSASLAGFVLHADRRDGGQAAARAYLGVELSDLAATFLGPGEWAARLTV